MAGEKNMRHSHATHDLYNEIANGNYPEWTWYVQVMDPNTEPESLGFDPLDDTKVGAPRIHVCKISRDCCPASCALSYAAHVEAGHA